MTVEYRSWIPESAQEVVTERHPGGQKYRVQYFLDGKLVGLRFFSESDNLEWEISLKDGKYHGILYRWLAPSKLESIEPWIDGVPHGVAKQWDENGNLVGSYIMDHGTGIDLWWQSTFNGRHFLAEVRYMKNGLRHGPEWWFS